VFQPREVAVGIGWIWRPRAGSAWMSGWGVKVKLNNESQRFPDDDQTFLLQC
jgi:hypothetical protein